MRNIVLDQGVDQAKGMALLAAVDRPDQRPVARIEFFNAIFLLNDFRAIHSQPRLAGHHDVARQPGDQTHAAETTDRSGRQADDRSAASQNEHGIHDLGNRREAEVRLLEPHAAGLQQDHRAGRSAVLAILGGQFEGGGHLRARHFSHASALEGAIEGRDDCGLSGNFSFDDDAAVVGLRGNALRREPRGLETIKRPEQLACGAGVHEGIRSFPCI